MFATLLGPLPILDDTERPFHERLAAVVDAQVGAGLGLLTDGGIHAPDLVATVGRGLGLAVGPAVDFPVSGRAVTSLRAPVSPSWRAPILVDAWRETAAAAGDHLVKATLPGPYTLGRLVDIDGGGPGRGAGNPPNRAGGARLGGGRLGRARLGRARLTLELAEALAQEVGALAAAGCRVIQVDEDGAMTIGGDEEERRLFQDAHRRLTDLSRASAADGPHLTLTLGWGNADTAGAATFFDAPYRSYVFDLIGGPDNWRLIVELPGDRGVVCGAIDPRSPGPGDVELLVWAARYAASTQGRGMERVGLAPGSGLELVAPEQALLKMRILGQGARLATASRDELKEWLDPRAMD